MRAALVLFTAGLLVLSWNPALPAADLNAEEFQQLLQELRPDEDEPWRTIPWKVDLLEAQQLAAQQQKPLFIWAMDGHPLGCT